MPSKKTEKKEKKPPASKTTVKVEKKLRKSPLHNIRGPVFKRMANIAGHRMVKKEMENVLRNNIHAYLLDLMALVGTEVTNRVAKTVTPKDIQSAYSLMNSNQAV